MVYRHAVSTWLAAVALSTGFVLKPVQDNSTGEGHVRRTSLINVLDGAIAGSILSIDIDTFLEYLTKSTKGYLWEAVDKIAMGRAEQLCPPSLHTRLKDWGKHMGKLETVFPGLDIVAKKTASTDDIVRQSKVICQDFIHDKLKTEGILSKKLEFNCDKKSQVSLTVIALGRELVKLHPKVYRDLSRKLNMTMCSELLVDKTLTQVLEHLLPEGGITWAKIVSMFTLSGQFAVECVQQGHPEFVKVIVNCIGHFVSAYLADWIASKRGWVGLVHAFRKKPDTGAFRALTIVATVVGLLATFVATVRIK